MSVTASQVMQGPSIADGTTPHRRDRNLVLVLCGGVGHSTQFMYDAVAIHPRYKSLADKVHGQPEARVLQMIAEQWYGLTVVDARSVSDSLGSPDLATGYSGLLVVVEDRSTNCGANASESRKVLEACGVPSPRSVIVVQDPTMCKRTVATFEKTYADLGDQSPRVVSWPTFVPEVSAKGIEEQAETNDSLWQFLDFSDSGPTGARKNGLWSMDRFVELVMGEIPRLRDDHAGYGPRGSGFIVHVDVPEEVEKAWKLVSSMTGATGRG